MVLRLQPGEDSVPGSLSSKGGISVRIHSQGITQWRRTQPPTSADSSSRPSDLPWLFDNLTETFEGQSHT